jgi:hypothetical protein
LQQSKAKREEAQRIAHVGYWEWNLDTDRMTLSDEKQEPAKNAPTILHCSFLNTVESTETKPEIAHRSGVQSAYKKFRLPPKCFYQMHYGNQ